MSAIGKLSRFIIAMAARQQENVPQENVPPKNAPPTWARGGLDRPTHYGRLWRRAPEPAWRAEVVNPRAQILRASSAQSPDRGPRGSSSGRAARTISGRW